MGPFMISSFKSGALDHSATVPQCCNRGLPVTKILLQVQHFDDSVRGRKKKKRSGRSSSKSD